MARHRQRARERKLQQPLRENVPGELDHASGEVEEVEASIIAGAGGEPLGLGDEDDSGLDAFGRPTTEEEVEAAAEAEDAAADARAASAARPRRRSGRDGDGAAPRAHAATPAVRRERTSAVAFLRASWAELQRVQWPDRRQVGQATAVVLGFVAIAGAYLGIADTVAQKIVNFII